MSSKGRFAAVLQGATCKPEVVLLVGGEVDGETLRLRRFTFPDCLRPQQPQKVALNTKLQPQKVALNTKLVQQPQEVALNTKFLVASCSGGRLGLH